MAQESLPTAAAPKLIEMNEQRTEKEEESAEVVRFTRLGVVEMTDRSLQDLNRGRESTINDGRNEVGVKGFDLLDKNVKFDMEEDGNGIEDVDSCLCHWALHYFESLLQGYMDWIFSSSLQVRRVCGLISSSLFLLLPCCVWKHGTVKYCCL